jgi:hypothetical protein
VFTGVRWRSAFAPESSVQKEAEKPPHGNEFKAPFAEVVVTGCRQMAARADCGRTLPRSHGRFDALRFGTEVGVPVDKPLKPWQPFRIVISSMARKRVAANLYSKRHPDAARLPFRQAMALIRGDRQGSQRGFREEPR